MSTVTELGDLTDEQLGILDRELRGAVGRMLPDETLVRAAMWILEPLMAEVVQREKAVEELRIQFEANGHEVWVGDEVMILEDGTEVAGWWAFCHCLTVARMADAPDHLGCITGDPADTEHAGCLRPRDEAVAVAGAHAADHGGKWEHIDTGGQA